MIENWLLKREAFKDFVQKANGKILDVGCGDAQLYIYLKKYNPNSYTYYAIDIDFKHPNKFKGAHLKALDVSKDKLPYPDEFFDYIICSHIIEHLENPWHAMRELTRVMKKGGLMLFALPNNYSIYARIKYVLFMNLPAYTLTNNHYSLFTKDTMTKLLKGWRILNRFCSGRSYSEAYILLKSD